MRFRIANTSPPPSRAGGPPSLPWPQYYDLKLIPLEQFTPELSLRFYGCPLSSLRLRRGGWDGVDLLSKSENPRKENFRFAAAEVRSRRDPSTAVRMTGE